MTRLRDAIRHALHRDPIDVEAARVEQIHRDWDRQLTAAYGPAERAEINAIFARAL